MKRRTIRILVFTIVIAAICVAFCVIAAHKGSLEKIYSTNTRTSNYTSTEIAPSSITLTPTQTPAAFSTATPAPEETPKEEERSGPEGRLHIRDWSAALVTSISTEIMDKEDTACLWIINNKEVITDRGDQGFDVIKECIEGEVCFIHYPNGAEKVFVCDCIDSDGHIEGEDIFDQNGASLYDTDFDLIMYVENEGGSSVTVTGWYLLD